MDCAPVALATVPEAGLFDDKAVGGELAEVVARAAARLADSGRQLGCGRRTAFHQFAAEAKPNRVGETLQLAGIEDEVVLGLVADKFLRRLLRGGSGHVQSLCCKDSFVKLAE